MLLKMDINGNKTLHAFFRGKKRTVQTNGNLPTTHRNGIGPWTERELEEYLRAVREL